MKKNIYSLPSPYRNFSKTLSTPIGIYDKHSTQTSDPSSATMYQQSNHLFQISEEFSNFSVKLEKEDQERYQNSFMKKRILSIWKEHRTLVKAAPQLPSPLEKTVYQNVFQKLKPMIKASFYEDFKVPLIRFTLMGWLQYSKLIAQILGKPWDALYWDEMTDFFNQCTELQLLSELEDQNE